MTGLVRIIILVMLIAFARTLFLKFQQNRQKLSANKQSKAEKKIASKKTVRCDHCGVYIPASEAIRDGEKIYCCIEHKEHDQ